MIEDEIKQAGGIGYGIKCDHEDDAQTKIVIDRIITEHRPGTYSCTDCY